MAYAASPVPNASSPVKPGRSYRYSLSSLSYVNLDDGNGGIIRDLSRAGLAVQAVARLQPDQIVHLRFEIGNPRLRVESEGRVVWVDGKGQAGVEFVSLPQRTERLVKDWIFTQLLSAASKYFGPDFMSRPSDHAGSEDGLTFSSAPHPAIRLRAEPDASSVQPWRILWFSLAPRRLAQLVDGLALLCAVLLFGVIALAITGVMPAWPIALAISLGLTGLTFLLYRTFFVVMIGTTPGRRLSGLDPQLSRENEPLEEGVRFR